MKKIILLVLALSLVLLCGCTGSQSAETTVPTTGAPTEAPTTVPVTEEPTEAPTEEPTESPTEAPTEPPVVYTNPLTGEALEERNVRMFAVTINNVPVAMPMYGVSGADLFFEMYINDYATRGLAVYSDISQVNAIGSVRSLRQNFIDICQAYDAIVVHAGGDSKVMDLLPGAGVSNINVEYEGSGYYYRDKTRLDQGYSTEHTLFVRGAETLAYAGSRGTRVTREEDRDFGLRFTGDGTPADGETALNITIDMIHDGVVKQTKMVYDETEGKYLFNQFGKEMWDSAAEEYIFFENVIVMYCPVYNSGVYHIARMEGTGDGYFACGGKIIPIKWIHENETDPFTFTLADGTPLELGVGSSYIAIAPLSSTVVYE